MNDWKRILEQLPEDENKQQNIENLEDTMRRSAVRKSGGMKALIASLIILAALVLAVGGFWFYKAYDLMYNYDKIYPGVTALGIQLGGMTFEEATDAIEEYSDNYFSGKQINVICGSHSILISLREASIEVDAADLARHAYNYGRIGGFFKRYKAINAEKIEPISADVQSAYDMAYIEKKIDELAEAVYVEYKNYGYTLDDNGLTIIKGRNGVSLDKAAAVAAVRQRLESNTFGDLLISADIRAAEIPDWNLLRDSFYIEAENAYVEASGDRGYSIVPEVIGKDIDIDQIYRDMSEPGWEEKKYPFIITTPEMTQEELASLLFRDVLATVSTKLDPSNVNRTENIRLATAAINGYIVLDYDNPNTSRIENQFSFNKVVGERTEARGYKPSIVFAAGEKVDGIGGGICQVSSTLYAATLLSELKVVERREHAFTVSYIPLGQDATVQWGFIDYVFENTSGYPMRIVATLEGNTLTVTFWGTATETDRRIELEAVTIAEYDFETKWELDPSLPKGTQRVSQYGQKGCRCELYKVVYIGDTEVERIKINSSYYNPCEQKIRYNPA